MKEYNTLSQEKFDKFIDSLIEKGMVKSKSDFARIMKLDFQGVHDKEMLNNRIFREKELKIDLALKASSIFKISINYFYDDTISVSNDPMLEHKLESIKLKEIADDIIMLNEKIDSFIKKTNSEKGEVLDAFKKDVKNLLNALNETAIRFILLINKAKLLTGENNDFARFLNEDEIISNIKNTKVIVNKIFDDLTENYSSINLFDGFVKLRDEFLIVDNYRFTIVVLEKMISHFNMINIRVNKICERINLVIEMFEKMTDSLNEEIKDNIQNVLINFDELSCIINLYTIINVKHNLLMLERKFYDYKIELNSDLKNQIDTSFVLEESTDYVDYKKIYEETYKLVLMSISNENVIFEFLDDFDQKLFLVINQLREFIN